MKAQNGTEKVLILGTSPLAKAIAEVIGKFPHRYFVVGYVDDACNSGGVVPRNNGNGHENGGNGHPEAGRRIPYPVIGPIDRLENAIKDLRPDRIIVPRIEDGQLPLQELLNSRIEGIWVEDGIEVYERLAKKLAIESLPPSFLIFSKEFNKPKYQILAHRTLSVGLAALGLVLTAPLMALIALLIKLDSKGPVLFIQERVGLTGRIFPLLKFRTMHSTPSEQPESVWSRDLSSRITRVGKWLRRLRLDELPQLINVVRGEMNIVGPRPEIASNVKTMTDQIPYYALRHMIRPGITGWAQIKYGYAVSKEEVTEKVRYDLYYIKHMSLLFDLRILIETAKIVLFGRGAI